MDIFCDNDDCKISFDFRGANTSVFCFTGIGLALGAISTEDIQKEEFRKSVKTKSCNCIYVIDKKRTWYASYDIEKMLLEFMDNVHEEWDVKNTVSIGNSMGGTGAIVFKDIVKQKITLSFSPQSTVSPSLAPFENRYKRFTQFFSSDHRYTDIAALPFQDDTFVFCGTNSIIDLQHAERMIQAGYNVIFVKGCEHNASGHLKNHGHISAIIDHAIHGCANDIQKYIHDNIEIICREEMLEFIELNKIAFIGDNQSREKRISALKRLSDIVPKNPYVYHQLGKLLKEQGDIQGAIAAQEQAVACGG